MSLINTMRTAPGRGLLRGTCANCKKDVYESKWILDDAYNVWAGRCPHCNAINMLALTSLRGYSAAGMDLVLPTDEERDANELPANTPTRGSHGPATVHGTVAGEIYHQLTKESTHG